MKYIIDHDMGCNALLNFASAIASDMMNDVENEDFSRERQLLIKLRSRMCRKDPGVYTIIGQCDIVIDRTHKTYATDGHTIWANPDFMQSLSHKENSTVLFHEFLHVVLMHNTRRGDIHPELWNIACDYKVNGLIKRSPNYGEDFQLPEGRLLHDFYSSESCDYSVERICHEMLKNGWEPEEPDGAKVHHGPGGDEDGDEDGEANGQDLGMGGILDSPVVEQGQEAIKRYEYEMMERLEQASLIEKSAGQGAGGTCTQIKNMSERGKHSSEEISSFLLKNMKSRRSFKKPNKRWLQRGMVLPSREKRVQDLYVATDSSASVGMDEFEQYRALLVRWADELRLDRIRVAYIDSKIHMNADTDEPWYDINLNAGQGAEGMELDIFGGGGTSFDPIFSYVEDSGDEHTVGALIYFTDGYGSVRVDEPNYPVAWVTSGIAPSFYGDEFGVVIEI
mgnify:CR=1 FL=1